MASIPLLNVDAADVIKPLKPEASLRCNDKYVIVYDFSDVGKDPRDTRKMKRKMRWQWKAMQKDLER